MKTATRIDQVREAVSQWKSQGKSIGLVPYHGLFAPRTWQFSKKSCRGNDVVIVSNFVNPDTVWKKRRLEQLSQRLGC